MCKVFIVAATGVRKFDPADLEVGVRLAQTLEKLAARDKPKPVAKPQMKPAVDLRPAAAPAPIQCGGDLIKVWPADPHDGDDCGNHYRMRCNASNERRKTKFLASRRHQVHCY